MQARIVTTDPDRRVLLEGPVASAALVDELVLRLRTGEYRVEPVGGPNEASPAAPAPAEQNTGASAKGSGKK